MVDDDDGLSFRLFMDEWADMWESTWAVPVVGPSFPKFGKDSLVLVEFGWLVFERKSTLLLSISTVVLVAVIC